MTRPGAVASSRSKVAPISCSDGVYHEQEHALIGHARQLGLVRRPAVDRIGIELIVGGVDDDAHRRAHDHAQGVGEAVTDVEEFDGEGAQVQDVSVRDGVQIGLPQEVVFT